MRVLLINGVYGYGSTGTIVRDIQSLCEQQGIECHVAYSMTNLSDNQVHNGFKIGSRWEKKMHALLCRINGEQAYFSYYATHKLIKYIERIQPNIVHLHTIHGNYLNMPMLFTYLAKKRMRSIVTMHDCWYYTGGCFHYTCIDCNKWQHRCGNCPKKKMDTPAYFLDKSSQILADRKRLFDAIPNLTITGVSRWICEESKKGIFRDKNVVTIHNGIDTSIFHPITLQDIDSSEILCKLQPELSGHFTILGPASKWLKPENNKLLAKILELGTDYTLVLYGCTAKQLTQELPNSSSAKSRTHVVKIEFTDDKETLAQIYNIADVFVNCTHEDTFSLITAEAQACGTPVISYANTGIKDIVNTQYGTLVETDDVEGMIEAIKKMKKLAPSQSNRLGLAEWAKSQFDKNINYKDYIDLYNSMVLK